MLFELGFHCFILSHHLLMVFSLRIFHLQLFTTAAALHSTSFPSVQIFFSSHSSFFFHIYYFIHSFVFGVFNLECEDKLCLSTSPIVFILRIIQLQSLLRCWRGKYRRKACCITMRLTWIQRLHKL